MISILQPIGHFDDFSLSYRLQGLISYVDFKRVFKKSDDDLESHIAEGGRVPDDKRAEIQAFISQRPPAAHAFMTTLKKDGQPYIRQVSTFVEGFTINPGPWPIRAARLPGA